MSTHNIGLELRSLNNRIMRYVDNHSNKKSIDRITGTNGWIIVYISEHDGQDVFQRDLERKFNITRSTASKVVNLMVQKGFIERQSVPYDARLKKLVLTDKASSIVELLDQDRKMVEETLTQGFTPEELEQLHGYLVRLKENVSFA